jgi:alpha-methylacyl-CoA racemase
MAAWRWPPWSRILRSRCAAPAALEPHFAQSLCRAAGIEAADLKAMFAPELHRAVAAFIGSQTRAQLDQLATEQDVPLYTLAD